MVPQQTKIEYAWAQYTDDKGLFTVKKIVTIDIAKVFSQHEALHLISKLKQADGIDD